MAPVVVKISEPLVLGEGPHWDVTQQCLYYVDIIGKTIHKYVPATNKHTKTTLDGRVGYIIPLEGTTDKFVVGVEREVLVIKWDGEESTPAHVVKVVAEVDQHYTRTRLNDAKADPRGRLFSGTMGKEDPPGKFEKDKGTLYKFEADGSHKALFGGLGIANGLAWDVARKAFYYIDSLEFAVRGYDYDILTGNIANKRIVFDLKANNVDGFPDGMTIDADGNLYIANFGSSRVLKVDPVTGTLLDKILIPVPQVTSVAFGGANLDELYVTTASMVWDGVEQLPPAGSTFKVTGLGVKGLPMASVKLIL